MGRQEHLQWCKKRDGICKLVEAVTSMMSDLNKHPETAVKDALAMLGIIAAQQAQAGDRQAVVRYITGFN